MWNMEGGRWKVEEKQKVQACRVVALAKTGPGTKYLGAKYQVLLLLPPGS